MSQEAVPAPSSPRAAADAHPELFARQSSGLVREIGFKDAVAMNLIIIAPAGAYIFMSTLLGTLPKVELVLPIIVAGIISLGLGLLYGQLVAAMPRDGGDYIFMSRVINPAAGAVVGGAFLIAFILSAGFGALFFAQVTFPFFLRAAGDGLGIHGLVTFAETIGTQTGNFIIGVIAVVVGAGIAIAGPRVATRTIFYGFVLTVIAIVLFVVYFLTTSHSGFVNAYNAASTSHAYEAIQSAAKNAGQPPNTSMSESWLAVPLCFLLYTGFTFAVYPGGEVKRAGSTVIRSILGSLLLAGVVLVTMWLSLRYVAGFDFLRSASFLSFADPEKYEHLSPVLPQGQEFWLLIAKDPVSKVVCGIGFGIAALIQVVAYLFVTSRVIFAMAFDRLLPTKLADVSKRTHSPVLAIVVSALLTLPWVYFGSYTTALSDIARNILLIFLVAFWLTSLGATVFPFRRPELYEASPKIFGGSLGGIPVITVTGTLVSIALAILIFLTVIHEKISGGYTTVSVTALVVSLTLGPVVYVISRLVSKRRGMDLKLAMTELPPE